MTDVSYKQFTESAQGGIKGEAFFESLIVDYAIPHRIARQNDLGVDFLCEWVYGGKPSGILFIAQVKYSTSDTITEKYENKLGLNGLKIFWLIGARKPKPPTIKYWKGLGLPAYLFMIVENKSDGKNHINCYYKRYTPLMAPKPGSPDKKDGIGTRTFHYVNEGGKFQAFNNKGGFARDLLIDYIRLSYSKGIIVPLNLKRLGFGSSTGMNSSDDYAVFDEFVGWYQEKIRETCNLTINLLNRVKK